MLKKIVLLFLMFISFLMYGQKQVVVLKTKFKQPFSEGKVSYNVFDEKTKQHWIIIDHKGKLAIFHLDNKFKFKKELKIKDLKNGVNYMHGHHVDENYITLFFSNAFLDKIGIVKINKKDYSIETDIIKFKINSEKVVQTIEVNNKFYVMTVEKNGSVVSLHEFKDQLKFTTHRFLFPEIGRKKNGEKTIKISKLLLGGGLKRFSEAVDLKKKPKEIPIQKIDENIPNPINIVSEKSKLYVRGKELIFTFDNDPEFTQLVLIDLEKYELESKEIKKFSFEKKIKSHNSFLKGDKILQICSNEDQMMLQIKNLSTGKKIKQFEFEKTNKINFNNTAIIQKGGLNAFTENRTRELDKTAKFLRKISKDNIGVSLYAFGENSYQLEIGGFQEKEYTYTGSINNIASFGGGIGVGLAVSVSVRVYSSVKYNKSIGFKSHLNQQLDWIEGEIPKNSFLQIKDFEDKLEGNIRAENNKYFFGKITKPVLKNIFNCDNKFYYSYVDMREGVYKTIEFTEE